MDGTVYNTCGNQKWDDVFSGGKLNFDSWFPSWI
jgi:hypothetical protein